MERLLETGAEVRILTRDPARARAKLSPQNLPKGDVAFVAPDIWRRGLSGATHVVNLAGEPISTRWDPKVKAEIMASRVKTTKTIVEHVNSLAESKRPKVLVNASAIGYYGTSETDTYDERRARGRLSEPGVSGVGANGERGGELSGGVAAPGHRARSRRRRAR